MEEDTQDPVAALEEIRGMEEIGPELDALTAEVNEDRELQVRELKQAFVADARVDTIRVDIMKRARAGVLEYEKVVAEDRARVEAGMQGPEAHRELKAKASEALDALFFKGRSHIEENAKRLQQEYGAASPAQPSAEVLAEASFGHAAFPNKAALTVLKEGHSRLQMARDETLSPQARIRQQHLLELLDAPLVERMATQPPRHAKALQPAFRKLHEAINVHLDTSRRGPHQRLAKAFASQALREYDFVVSMVKDQDGWGDGLIQRTGAPSFDWATVEGE